MKLYAPSYYKDFKCIADKCNHSCCIGWEIDIDEDTLKKYKTLKSGYGIAVAQSISTENAPHFKLSSHDRCPHLDGRGLCKIIINLGEDYLCDICREHPRFYNYTTTSVEVGLGMSCPEAARLILSSCDYSDVFEIGERDAVADSAEFDGRHHRCEIYEILKKRELSYDARLEEIYRRFSQNAENDGKWLEIIDSLEYLDAKHKRMFMNYSSKKRPKAKEFEEYLERFLAYLVYRHCTEAFDKEDFCLRLGFCLFCERLLSSLICSEKAVTLDEVAIFARVISEEIEYSDDNTLALM